MLSKLPITYLIREGFINAEVYELQDGNYRLHIGNVYAGLDVKVERENDNGEFHDTIIERNSKQSSDIQELIEKGVLKVKKFYE